MPYIKTNNEIRRWHPSSIAIQVSCQGSSFSSSAVERSMQLGIKNLKKKAFHDDDIPFKILEGMLSSPPTRFVFIQ